MRYFYTLALLVVFSVLIVGCNGSARIEAAPVIETEVPLTATPAPTVQAITPIAVSVSFEDPAVTAATVQVGIITNQAEIEFLVGTGPDAVTAVYGNVAIPTTSTFASPCGIGQNISRTGGFSWNPAMPWKLANGEINPQYHPGIDGGCYNGIYAAADSLILAVYSDLSTRNWISVDIWISGHGYKLASKMLYENLPVEVQSIMPDGAEYVIIIHVYGHLQFDNALQFPQSGIVAQGTQLGWMGSTGRVTGPHLHYGTAVLTSNGTLYWVNPHLFGA